MGLAATKDNAPAKTKSDRSFFSKKGRSNYLFFQAKLTIGPTNDIYEKEADAVADKVMCTTDTDHAVQPKLAISSIQRTCAECVKEEEEHAQRKESGVSSSEAPSIVQDVVHSGGGVNLDNETRGFMENRFGYDFSNVKIHNDTVAAESAQSINALAYTSGNKIVFNRGQYSPGTDHGKKLLAHELTHVVQQKSISRVQRQTDAGYEGLSGVAAGLTAGTMVADPIMGRTFTMTCGNQYTMAFTFSKAYKGTYPYQAARRDVNAVYVKIEASYTDLRKCGRCTPMRLIQVARDTVQNARGGLQTTQPHGAARQTRAGWSDPAAASRGWYVDMTDTGTNPYVTSLGYHANEGSETTPAILWDSPGEWTSTTNRGAELQTCAVCEDAAHRKRIVSCVNWGYYINASGNIAFRPATPVATCGHTTEARDASQRWDSIAGNTPTDITF